VPAAAIVNIPYRSLREIANDLAHLHPYAGRPEVAQTSLMSGLPGILTALRIAVRM